MAQQNQKKKKGFPWIALFVMLGMVFQFSREAPGGKAVFGMVVMAVGVVIVIEVVKALVAARKKSGAAAKSEPRRSYSPEVAARRPDPRSKSFTSPDPHCVVCENTGEDHFQRDKAQRIRQLDEWLKNGIIDKKEYFVLKDRFEKNL